MFGKVFFAGLVATVFIQAESGNFPLEYQLANYIDDAKGAFQTLVGEIENATRKAVEEVMVVRKDLDIYTDEIIQQYSFKIHEELKKLDEQLREIEEDAEAEETNISECLQGREANFTKLPRTYLGKIIECVKEKVSEGKEIVNDTIRAVKENIKEVKGIEHELDECGGGVEALACYTRVIAKTTAQVANILVKISSDVTRAVKLIATLKSSLKACVKGNFLQMVIEGQKIIENVTECVSKKIKYSISK